MTRFGTKLAAGAAALALAAAPGWFTGAAAQTGGGPADVAVDERTGPVAFANVVAAEIGEDGQGGGFLVTKTQRSPLRPGSSTLSRERVMVPQKSEKPPAPGEPDERATMGDYLVRFGPDAGATSPFPAEVPSREHDVVATLRPDTVPTATAEANYALQVRPATEGDGGGDDTEKLPGVAATVFAIQEARSAVECAAVDRVESETSAATLWVRQRDGELTPVDPPAVGEELTLTDLPIGAPLTLHGADPAKTTSDVVVRRVTAFDQLLRQEEWRDGDVTGVGGWAVRITSHLRDSEGEVLVDKEGEPTQVVTRLVLGGVSCSLPAGFTPVLDRPTVPVKIPAGWMAEAQVIGGPVGDRTIEAEAPFDPAAGVGLVAGGALLGAGAVMLWRRARRAGLDRTDHTG
ncbi:hypothetical protein SAMN05421810_104183 [Amycolatopsis arida]|uniref:LPXTG-motif cell wall anchor domain-containing protein n=1 Tax=Amycolatopsis arida TaxID=587909 RepID=A0A1I5V0U9_9PSEU|nr:hypothetical protein [Amycolatopsis arida]TDX91102.1 hypothetical protein CLV69_106182 [Amycolatopsis arida]SFQ01042.1 hypothetical protein SAMN05421810_104183 [Amycolatopsis arida]